MNYVPLIPAAYQKLSTTLNGQQAGIVVYQKSTGLYIDVTLAGQSIVSTQKCLNRVLLVRYAYLGFVGDLSFIDTFQDQDPYWKGLGSRYQLAYLLPSDIVPYVPD